MVSEFSEDALWFFQRIFRCGQKELVDLIESWPQDKVELLAERCDNIIQTMPVGDQEILGYILAYRVLEHGWFFQEYFQSTQVLQPYIVEFEQYCAAVPSRLQTPT